MKTANKFYSAFMALTLIAFTSCEKDGGKLPNISLKSGTGYTASSATLVKNTALKIGITASKAEDKDVLKQFDISKSVKGGAATSIYNVSLSGSNGNSYSYDYNSTVDTTSGQQSKYIFTITNRDGLTNSVSVTVSTQ